MQFNISVHETLLIVYFLVIMNVLFAKLKDFSCHAQTWLAKNMVMRHVFNIMAVFFVIVIYTRTNPIHPMIIILLTFVMYMFFMLITRCDYRFLVIFMFLIVTVFFIESYKAYYKKEIEKGKQQLEPVRQVLIQSQLVLEIVSLLIIAIGFLIYLGQKSREYPKWSWMRFWLGVEKCSSNSLAKRLTRNMSQDFMDGLRRVFT